eukprot:s548_g6.t2
MFRTAAISVAGACLVAFASARAFLSGDVLQEVKTQEESQPSREEEENLAYADTDPLLAKIAGKWEVNYDGWGNAAVLLGEDVP